MSTMAPFELAEHHSTARPLEAPLSERSEFGRRAAAREARRAAARQDAEPPSDRRKWFWRLLP